MPNRKSWLELLTTGADIIHRKGFCNTGINDVLESSGVPKGSFYHYFRNKEDFGLHLADYYAGYIGGRLEAHLGRKDLPAIQRLEAFFMEFEVFFRERGYALGCPLGKLSQEMSDLSDIFRERLDLAMTGIVEKVAECLEQAKDEGSVYHGIDALETAEFIMNSWQGALLRMKVMRGPGPLSAFLKIVFGKLLKV